MWILFAHHESKFSTGSLGGVFRLSSLAESVVQIHFINSTKEKKYGKAITRKGGIMDIRWKKQT